MRTLILTLALFFARFDSPAVLYNADYVKALYSRYPTRKSAFCKACKFWDNSYYQSIADTFRHMPLITYQRFSRANYAKVATMRIPRKGVFAYWNAVNGQSREDKVYVAANKIAQAYDPEDIIAKGHCQPWILNAFSYDSAILSNTYTFNAACENQSQNIGTELASENVTRRLLADHDVEVWCGTYGSQSTFTDGKITNTYPAVYWKIIKCDGKITCYWMPNRKKEKRNLLSEKIIPYAGADPSHPGLINLLKFKPENYLPHKENMPF